MSSPHCRQVSAQPRPPRVGACRGAVAVGVVLAGLFVEKGYRKREKNRKALSGEGREFLAASMKHVLGGKVARTAAARRDIVAMIDRQIARAPLEDRDARAWHLVLRALGNDLTPKDLGLELHERRGRRRRELERTRPAARQAPRGDAG